MSSSPLSYKQFPAVLLMLSVVACGQALYIPSIETVADADADKIEQLTTGRQLYIKNCAGCHNLYPPQKFSADHWKEEMVEMQEEAKITDSEARLILSYLTGYRD